MKNNQSRQITVSEMAPHIHSFEYGENRVEKITKWLIEWIKNSLKNKRIAFYDFLPSKQDLASHIGVSLGTMQNVFRNLEDIGLVESKQRVGTYITTQKTTEEKKLTSKRELVIELIKSHILKNKYKSGDRLLSIQKISEEINYPSATIRNAINNLVIQGIITKKGSYFFVNKTNFETKQIENLTLVEKIAKNIKKMISDEKKKSGDKLPSNPKLAQLYGVSIKTIHDAVKMLTKEGVVVSKRGKYGTVVADAEIKNKPYFYEEAEMKIKNYIIDNCDIGSKLPSIKDFSVMFNVSTKTIKKALDNMSEDGFVAFSRGRHGGTFVTDIPNGSSDAYTWLALSSEFMNTDNN